MKKTTLFLVLALAGQMTFGQISAKLMRYMDVSDSHITFVYGGDIWITSKEGGTALQLTHSPAKNHGPGSPLMAVPLPIQPATTGIRMYLSCLPLEAFPPE